MEDEFDLINKAYEFNDNEKWILRKIIVMCENVIEKGISKETITLGFLGKKVSLTIQNTQMN